MKEMQIMKRKSKLTAALTCAAIIAAAIPVTAAAPVAPVAPAATPNPLAARSAPAVVKSLDYKFKDTELNLPGTFPIRKTPITLTVAMPQHANVASYEDNELTRFFEEKSNIKLKWDVYPIGNEGMQKLQVVIASRAKLPDILVGFGISDEITFNYGKNGIIQDLTPYYKSGLAANFDEQVKKAGAGEDMVRKMLIAPDGKYYYISKYTEQNGGNIWTSMTVINNKFLEAVNLKVPKTTDELYTVLKAFKEKDPNKNGKADEIPMLGSTVARQDIIQWVMSAFVYNDNNERLFSKNGKISVVYNTDEWREGLRYLNKLFNEGLLSPLSFTQNYNQIIALTGAKEPTVGMLLPGNAFGAFTNMPDNRAFDYGPVLPLKGPKGVQYTIYYGPVPINNWSITKDCKYPEAAFMLGDYMWSEEATLRSRWGIPGVHFDYLEPGEKNSIGIDLHFKILNNIWGSVQKVHWNFNNPGTTPSGFTEAFKAAPPKTNDPDPERFNREYAKLSNYGPEEPIIVIKYDDKEMNEIKDIRANLKTYVTESMARFITGDMKIETNWDAYLKELNSIGLKKFVDTTQTAWDRMNK